MTKAYKRVLDLDISGEREFVRARQPRHLPNVLSVQEVRLADTDIRTVQALLVHKDVRTTMRYTHLAKTGPYGVISPLDR